MSIIHQALKKAQRERQIHTVGVTSQPEPSTRFRQQRTSWLSLTVGGVLALTVGVGVYTQWQRTNHTVAAIRHTPQPLRGPTLTTPESVAPVPRQPTPTSAPQTASNQHPQPSTPPTMPTTATRVVAARQDPPPATPPPPPSAAAATEPTQRITRPPAPALQTQTPRVTTSPEPTAQLRVTAQALFTQALEAQRSGETERALALLQQTVALDPTLKGAFNSLGNLYYARKQYHQALGMYHKALEVDPAYGKARNNLGSTYLQLAMHDQAIVELQHALRTESESGLAYYNLACVYARTGESDKAAQYLRQAIQREPDAQQWAQTDADFTQVRTTPVFRQLLGSSP